MSPAPDPPRVQQLVDHLFRHQSGQLVASLTRVFGPAHLERVEDVVQESLLRALHQWSFHGVPDQPEAWLRKVARNLALDALRHDDTRRRKQDEVQRRQEPDPDALLAEPDELQDDLLRFMFACCHEAIPRESRVALTLKTLGGFEVREIAHAFLCAEATIAQRLVRAKRRLREADVSLETPGPELMHQRLDSVLDVLYLMFSEGYASRSDRAMIRRDLVEEALRLTRVLVAAPSGVPPKVHALLALMLFQSSRLSARLDDQGCLLLLEQQDRTSWDHRRIQQACAHLRQAGRGDELTRYHLEAGIASCHAFAPSFEATDWERILAFYDQLLEGWPSPIVALNRAVALAMVRGPAAGLAALDALDQEALLAPYALWHSTRGEFLRRVGDREAALDCFRQAAAHAGSDPEREFLRRRIAACQ